MTKEEWRRALISLLIGVCVAAATSLVDGLLQLLKVHFLDIAGSASAMIYYLKSRRVA